MGRYSSTGIAHGTNGAPQITAEESTYELKINEIVQNLNLDINVGNKAASAATGRKENKSFKKNILSKIIALIMNMGYKEVEINTAILYKKNNIILKVFYDEECEYYFLEKADNILDAENNIFELLASISNDIRTNEILKMVRTILENL